MFMGRDLDDCYNDLPFKLGDNTISCCNNMHLLGVSIDDNFITNITRKVSNQLQVLKRHKKLIPVSAKALYKAYILPQLNYCSIVWHHCGKRNSDKLEKLNQRCLCFVLCNSILLPAV